MNEMRERRTTVTADRDDLDTLAAEAARREVSLTTVLAEAVAEKASAIRARRRPRFGVARSTDDRSAVEVTAEPIAEPPR
ncbi:MAG: hypothetical protein M3Z25_22335 [Actinomycetota bacterium]|nr:hypothetical protein [Pseudonocardiales bacterium]MDQ2710188.1 hypothetical protein [Actinomycetota bacterium]